MTHALRELIGQSRISTEKSGRPFLPVTSLQVSVEVPSTTVESTGGTRSPFYPVIPIMLSTLNCYLVHSYDSRDPFPDLMAQGGNPFIHWVKH